MGQKERKKLWVFQHHRMETLLVYVKHQPIRLLHKVGLHGKVTDLSFCFKLINFYPYFLNPIIFHSKWSNKKSHNKVVEWTLMKRREKVHWLIDRMLKFLGSIFLRTALSWLLMTLLTLDHLQLPIVSYNSVQVRNCVFQPIEENVFQQNVFKKS